MIIHMFCHIFFMCIMTSSTFSISPLDKEQWMVVLWLMISKLNIECLAIRTVTSIVKGRFKNIIFLSYAFNYDLWCNILRTNEGLGALASCVL
jgi:hypothetical protein